MFRESYCSILIIFILLTFSMTPLSAEAEKDSCAEEGIVVKNLTMMDLWYKKNRGECFIWIHDHIFSIKPEDSVEIFSDLTCQTQYCQKNPTYKDYTSADMNGNCRVRILPDCSISDM